MFHLLAMQISLWDDCIYSNHQQIQLKWQLKNVVFVVSSEGMFYSLLLWQVKGAEDLFYDDIIHWEKFSICIWIYMLYMYNTSLELNRIFISFL